MAVTHAIKSVPTCSALLECLFPKGEENRERENVDRNSGWIWGTEQARENASVCRWFYLQRSTLHSMLLWCMHAKEDTVPFSREIWNRRKQRAVTSWNNNNISQEPSTFGAAFSQWMFPWRQLNDADGILWLYDERNEWIPAQTCVRALHLNILLKHNRFGRFSLKQQRWRRLRRKKHSNIRVTLCFYLSTWKMLCTVAICPYRIIAEANEWKHLCLRAHMLLYLWESRHLSPMNFWESKNSIEWRENAISSAHMLVYLPLNVVGVVSLVRLFQRTV